MNKQFLAMTIALFAPMFARADDFDMPAQPLDSSLQELSKRSDVQFVFSGDVDTRQAVPALSGIRTMEAALDTLLARTNLTYHVLDPGKIEIAPMDEVQITGRHEKLSAMKKEYEKLENEFFRLYNSLNTNHDYDVFCGREGTFIKFRVCTPVFVNKATMVAAGDLKGGHAGVPAIFRIQATMPDFRNNMRAQVTQNPKLLELLMKRNAAAQRYVVARKKKFEGEKIFVWD
jgi:hypothetical protein